MRTILINARKKINLTQVEISKKIKISTTHYQRLEYGTRNPSLKVAKRLENLLGVSVEDLFPEDL